MASANARRAAAVLRDRTRTNRAATAARRSIATAARRVRTGSRSLATHVIATGADAATVKGVVKALQTAAKAARANGLKGKRARIRRSFTGAGHTVKTVYRYTREQVAQIAAQYKPRKAEYKAVRAALLAA
ncbi:hypothetical protein OG345_42105 (plasmid) [Streptomyces sp. NBC_01220]|uniref:hypothetical protein n=1 Tax=Streptomyces sp. NBC_01220 TaxID=2903781 RepID=UPI00352DB22D|nr:hypothetical protein OG345_42105 [Streptomyces sp. NBC_01220]